jgi:hypothetical protein
VVGVDDDQPLDPFRGDPADPAHELARLDDPDDAAEPLSVEEREGVLADLEDLEVFRTLLEPRGVRGVVVDCGDCGEAHYFDWDLLQGNLRHLLDRGTTRVHEPAFEPDPEHYVPWDYAKGFSDAVLDVLADDD